MSFLFLVLSARHLKRWLKVNLQPMRRRLGLATFIYAVLHMLAYTALILGFEFSQLAADIQKRPYILVGALAILLMLPLAVTSTKAWQKRLKRNGKVCICWFTPWPYWFLFIYGGKCEQDSFWPVA
jgi:sulfoxide reductase heme-binding subunit YedZ